MRGVYQPITMPTEYPVTLSDLVSVHIKVDDTDPEADLINEYIKAATELVEDYTQRTFMQTVWEYQAPDFSEMDCEGYLKLMKAPLVSVESVKYVDSDKVEQTMDTSDYQVQSGLLNAPGRIKFIGSVPSLDDRPDAVKIRFTAGYGAEGATTDQQRTAISEKRASRAKIAILRAVAGFYEHRQDESRTPVYELTENIRAILSPLRLFL